MSPASVRGHGAARIKDVPPESQSDTSSAESIAVQVIEENADLAKQYASGDLTVLNTLQEKALQLAAGRVKEPELKDTLMRKLGASY